MLAEIIKKEHLKEYGINSLRMTFTDPNGRLKYLKKAMLIVGLPLLLFMIVWGIIIAQGLPNSSDRGGMNLLGIESLALILLAFIITIIMLANQYRFACNMMVYVWCDEHLYRILETNESISSALLANDILGSGAALAAAGYGEREL